MTKKKGLSVDSPLLFFLRGLGSDGFVCLSEETDEEDGNTGENKQDAIED